MGVMAAVSMPTLFLAGLCAAVGLKLSVHVSAGAGR